ncbi:MAG: hypothetical protein ACFFEK_09795 [Candidatus Thorarchaeota archaeon]
MSTSKGLSVKVWTNADEFDRGIISYTLDGVKIELESGKIVSGEDSEDVSFEIQDQISLDEAGQSVVRPIKSRLEVLLKPVLIIRHPFTNVGGQIVEDVFPPSTAGFYGRLLAGNNEAIYFLQRVKGNRSFLLSIVDPFTSKIYETHQIQPYEAEALSLIDNQRVDRIQFNELLASRSITRDEVLRILDSPAPSWQDLSKIVGDISIPNLRIGKTMRETFDRIVPTSFPESIREELMAFLAYVVKSDIPDDPLSYSFRFSSTRLLQMLVLGHTMHLIEKTDWPPYVKLMILAARGQIKSPKRAVSDSTLNLPWFVFSQKCAEYLPSWMDVAIEKAKTLNESGRIVLGLPTTKAAARRSRKSWKSRFVEMSPGLMVKGQIATQALGLVELVYLGAAYRWPHKHMRFITRLGSARENPPHLQVMLVPHNAAERIRRTLPSVLDIVWSARTSNMDLFDNETHTWNVPIQRILDSVEKKCSIRKLMNQFSEKNTPDTYSISKNDAKVLDLIAEGVHLYYLEMPEYLSNLGLNKKLIHRSLTNLVNRKVMDLKYEVFDTNLISLAVIMQGKSGTVTSIISELLQNTPTSYARINKSGESGVVLSRLPETSVHEMAYQLTSQGIEQGVNIRCMRPTAFRGYTSNLYQRLLMNNGSWDDDVSAFLSQARSKRREMSESNA